nr:MAG TPA: hypothetical protein [Caudoviricetes sp.]
MGGVKGGVKQGLIQEKHRIIPPMPPNFYSENALIPYRCRTCVRMCEHFIIIVCLFLSFQKSSK